MSREPTSIERAIGEVLVLLPEFNDSKAVRCREVVEECARRAIQAELHLLSAQKEQWEASDAETVPFWAATNALIQELSVIEGKSIKDVVAELKQREASTDAPS